MALATTSIFLVRFGIQMWKSLRFQADTYIDFGMVVNSILGFWLNIEPGLILSTAKTW